MRFFTIITVLATAAVTSALPEQAKAQASCIGLNDRFCDNATVNFACCQPLTCGSDSRCHR